jgi:hypothetical protein
MIRHIVLIRFRPEITASAIDSIFADLRATCALLPGALAMTAGRSESPEQIERGYLHGFVIDFTDWAALAAYQEHPDHKRAGAALVAGAVGGLDGILVFDLAVTDHPITA